MNLPGRPSQDEAGLQGLQCGFPQPRSHTAPILLPLAMGSPSGMPTLTCPPSASQLPKEGRGWERVQGAGVAPCPLARRGTVQTAELQGLAALPAPSLPPAARPGLVLLTCTQHPLCGEHLRLLSPPCWATAWAQNPPSSSLAPSPSSLFANPERFPEPGEGPLAHALSLPLAGKWPPGSPQAAEKLQPQVGASVLV